MDGYRGPENSAFCRFALCSKSGARENAEQRENKRQKKWHGCIGLTQECTASPAPNSYYKCALDDRQDCKLLTLDGFRKFERTT